MKNIVMNLGVERTTEKLEPIGADGSFKGQLLNREKTELDANLKAFEAGNLEAVYKNQSQCLPARTAGSGHTTA